MYRNKEIRILFFMAITAFSCLTACNFIKEQKGTVPLGETDENEYLDVEILTNPPKETESYQTYVLSYGTFTDAAGPGKISRAAYLYEQVKAEVEMGDLILVSMELKGDREVKKGEVLATVSVSVDSVNILEAELDLQILKEQYQRAREDFDERREQALEANKLIYNEYERKADSIFLEGALMDWQHTANRYEKQIREKEETIERLNNWSGKTTILAPRDGYAMLPDTVVKAGEVIKDGTVICNLYEKEAETYFADNQNALYRYGTEISMVYEDVKYEGKVFTGTSADLYGNLDPEEQTCVRFDTESQEKLLSQVQKSNVSGGAYNMENVLLVPVKAVTEENKMLYVTVVKPDGSLLKTGFFAGGSNAEYYWVLSGLEEGARVLVKE